MTQFDKDSSSPNLATLERDLSEVRKELRRLSDLGLYLDAYEFAKGKLGDDLLQWSGCDGGLIALKMADRLGGTQLSNVLTYRMGRRYPDDPEVRFLRTMQKLSHRPLAQVWLQIRGQELDTDDDELKSQWAIVKGLILCGMRDFDRGFDWLEIGRKLSPDDPRPVLRIATAYLSCDKMDQAIQTCRDAITMLPSYPPSIQTLSHLLLQDNQVDEAFAILQQSVDTTQSGGCRLQLASMEMQRHEYEKAATLVDGIGQYFPLADPARRDRAKRDSVLSSIAKIRSELACHRGDYETAIALAKIANNPFHDTLAENLERNSTSGKRVRLKVPFVRQNHVTCAPATLTMLSSYWGIEVDHDAVVNEICYDGTAPVKQRVWAEENGLIAREFRLTEMVAHQLIDAEIPFAISTVDPGSGHINVVCGYDSRRGVLLMQDPGTWHAIEALLREFIEQYEAFGPRGLILIPPREIHRLESIELPDSDKFDQQHAIAAALQNHDRDSAANIFEKMKADAPEHSITLWAETEVARYDVNLPVRLDAMQRLRDRFPKTELLTLAECDLLALFDRQDKVVERLRECVKGETPSTESRLRLMRLLESEEDSQERLEQLRTVLRTAPTNPEGLSNEAIRLWDRMERDDALELLRLAAMSGERDEEHARRYLAAAIRMSRREEALDVLRERFEKHGHASGQPAITYAYALARTTHADRAADVIRRALQMRSHDGELLCEAASALGQFEKPAIGLELIENATIPLPADQVLFTKANLAMTDGRPYDALDCLTELYRLQPMNFDIAARIADLKASLEGMNSTLDFLHAIVQSYPHCRSMLSITAEYLHKAARYEEAVRYLDQILETCDFDAWAWRERSLVCSAAGWYDEAHRSALKGLDCEKSAMSYNILAEAQVGRGEIEAALENCRQAIQMDCDHMPAVLTWIKLCENESQAKEVLAEHFRELIRQRSNGSGVVAYKRFATGMLDDQQICQQLNELCEVRPDVLTIHKVAADHHCDYRRFDEAEKVLLDGEKRFSHQPEYWQDLGEIYIGKNDLPAAVSAFEKALELDPFNSELAIRTSQVYQSVDRPQDAEQTLRQALGAAPSDASLMVELGRSTEDEDERRRLIHDAAMLSPNCGDTWGLFLSLCQYENREPDAVAAARDLVTQRPNDSNANIRLAEMLHREDQWEESVGVLKAAIQRDRRNVDLHGLLAQRYYERDMVEEAIEACSPEGIDPYDLSQLNLFAANLLNLTEQTEKACERIQLALERDPSNLEAWSRLADWAMNLENDELYDMAATALLDRGPNVALSHGYYSVTALRNGDRDAAKFHLRQAFELDPSYTYALTELLGLYIEDNEIAAADAFVKSIKDKAESIPLAIAHATLALAHQDYNGFVTVFQKLPDASSATDVARNTLRHFDEQPDGILASTLTKAMKRKNATEALGHVWSCVNVSSDDPSTGIKKLMKLPRHPEPFLAAVMDVLGKLYSKCEYSDSVDAATRKKYNRLAEKFIKRIGALVYTVPDVWRQALWVLMIGDQEPKMKTLARNFRRVENRDANTVLPAVLYGVHMRDARFAGEVINDVFSRDPENMANDMMTAVAMYGVFAMDVDDLEVAILQADKNELYKAFKSISKLMTVGVQCLKAADGNEEPLIDTWMEVFVKPGKDEEVIDRNILAELRARIAESVGNRRLARKHRKSKYVQPRELSESETSADSSRVA
ncbi:tetratricopeptide repeat protein [Stieleria sp. JC731]|uniref:tetratricopeptide repeat protein n=1 Tax=Pirellulaceae TaxID=2691357 RepID=UPI001E5A4670|nr:tetratricopeptide repeat protein [Stieleria sp. JC731]MCC9600259.1 tetratricopeptide repeat protein [Stieleria sp. JC731]